MNNLVLCGFMGCGKTTVGRLLAARTGRRFVDTDALIEEEAGMAVEDILNGSEKRISGCGSGRLVPAWLKKRIW